LNKIPQNILEQIKNYCRKNPDIECCGVVYCENEQLSFLECENISDNPTYNFVIDPVILIDYDVEYIVHSHPVGSSRPSTNDIRNSDESCIPYLIYSIRDNDFYLYENISV
jgi:proteasome lid subunit RPN8/RPN11